MSEHGTQSLWTRLNLHRLTARLRKQAPQMEMSLHQPRARRPASTRRRVEVSRIRRQATPREYVSRSRERHLMAAALSAASTTTMAEPSKFDTSAGLSPSSRRVVSGERRRVTDSPNLVTSGSPRASRQRSGAFPSLLRDVLRLRCAASSPLRRRRPDVVQRCWLRPRTAAQRGADRSAVMDALRGRPARPRHGARAARQADRQRRRTRRGVERARIRQRQVPRPGWVHRGGVLGTPLSATLSGRPTARSSRDRREEALWRHGVTRPGYSSGMRLAAAIALMLAGVGRHLSLGARYRTFWLSRQLGVDVFASRVVVGCASPRSLRPSVALAVASALHGDVSRIAKQTMRPPPSAWAA